ncbi:MAG: phosphoadenosine phosphosulfate reductase family protein, partial [Chloroflexi bacterium]|nr:phosphoadenosine phosphosulfate reductase family protein [Chloroflexota bacterium]
MQQVEQSTLREIWSPEALEAKNQELERYSPTEIVEWALNEFGPDITLACSFGGVSGMALLDMALNINPDVPVFYADTDFLFPETYAFKDAVAKRYDFQPLAFKSALTPEEQAAKYGEALWAQASAEPGEERAAYLDTISGFLRRQKAMNQGFAPTFPAMASRYYDDPQLTFMKADDVYAKGALVLHMLHELLGDEDFWRGTRLYLDRFKGKMAETDDFRHALEDVSGVSLEQFFDQWVFRPGLPRLRVDADWDESAGAL